MLLDVLDAHYYQGILRPDVVCEAVRQLSEKAGSPNRFGGMLGITVVNSNSAESTADIRSIGRPGLKISGYAKNVTEKMHRLHTRRVASHNEWLASVSADPCNEDESKRTYGGCVVGLNSKLSWVYIAYSGTLPDIDELVCYVAGERLELTLGGYKHTLLAEARILLQGCVQA